MKKYLIPFLMFMTTFSIAATPSVVPNTANTGSLGTVTTYWAGVCASSYNFVDGTYVSSNPYKYITLSTNTVYSLITSATETFTSLLGDNLGNHIATTTLNMDSNNIINAGHIGVGSDSYPTLSFVVSKVTSPTIKIYNSATEASSSLYSKLDLDVLGGQGLITAFGSTYNGSNAANYQSRVVYENFSNPARGHLFVGAVNVSTLAFSDGTTMVSTANFVISVSSIGDNLGNHTATTTLEMFNFNITNVSTITLHKIKFLDDNTVMTSSAHTHEQYSLDTTVVHKTGDTMTGKLFGTQIEESTATLNYIIGSSTFGMSGSSTTIFVGDIDMGLTSLLNGRNIYLDGIDIDALQLATGTLNTKINNADAAIVDLQNEKLNVASGTIVGDLEVKGLLKSTTIQFDDGTYFCSTTVFASAGIDTAVRISTGLIKNILNSLQVDTATLNTNKLDISSAATEYLQRAGGSMSGMLTVSSITFSDGTVLKSAVGLGGSGLTESDIYHSSVSLNILPGNNSYPTMEMGYYRGQFLGANTFAPYTVKSSTCIFIDSIDIYNIGCPTNTVGTFALLHSTGGLGGLVSGSINYYDTLFTTMCLITVEPNTLHTSYIVDLSSMPVYQNDTLSIVPTGEIQTGENAYNFYKIWAKVKGYINARIGELKQ